jgi:FtsP/CotA-like multicopper oxidase with cupredoxin domain
MSTRLPRLHELAALSAVAAIAAATLAAGQLFARASAGRPHVASDETLREPSVISSRNGVLRVALNAAPSTIEVAGKRARAAVYDGSYLPPTLRVRPGDEMRIRLANALDEPTNLHTHGLAVSPRGTSDDIFLSVAPGQAQEYDIRLPASQSPGLYWYHPHSHGNSDEQVRNGMSGALIVDGLLDPFPALRNVHERLLLLKDIQIDSGRVAHLGIGKQSVRTVDGQLNPTIVMRPGETQLWRIGNIGADLYYELSLDGHPFFVVARDGHRLARVERADTLVLSPGARAEVLVQGGVPGTYVLRTGDIDTGPAGNTYRGATLATLRVEGATEHPIALPTALLPVEDLRPRVTARRTIVFSESPDGNSFFIDGKAFDMSRTDQRVKLGTVEEWTIRNEADERHSFHIHQTPFQVAEINGVAQPADGYRDIVDVPIGGEVKVVIPFTDPSIVGRFVFHCHILSHEDRGMMATIEVDP